MAEEKMPESVSTLIKEISEKSGTPQKEVKKLIEEKQDELSGLVSPEGAAYMVGRELGVNLIKEAPKQFKIKNIITGMRSVDIVAKLLQVWDVREFSKKTGGTGRVMNLLFGDETGTIRLSLWDEQIDAFNSMGIKEGDVLDVTHAWTKADNRDNPEMRLGKSSTIRKSDAMIDAAKPAGHEQFSGGMGSYQRKDISDLKEGISGEIRACMVQVYSRNMFYNVCPQCGGRVEEQDGKFRCEEHGEVAPKKQMILSGIADDGTGSIRVVFFRDNAEKVVGRNVEELKKIMEKNKSEDVAGLLGCLGREMLIRGNVRINKLTENLEMVANEVDDVDARAECDRLLRELSAKKEKLNR
jgi:ssDNA-binding replication factor A large subunit